MMPMFSDKRPSKYIILAALLFALLIALVISFGLQARASGRFLPIKEITTASGLKVWLVEDHSLPVISLKFLFKDAGTILDPEDKQGLVRLLSNTMDEGAGELDSQAFQKALSDHSITLAFNASRDGFGGEIKTLSRHKDKAFELLGLAINKPRFDAEPVERMRDANLTRLRSSMTKPEWINARLLNDRAYEGHPYAKNSGGTLTSLRNITADDLRNFYKTNLTQDRLIIAVTGDINEGEVSKKIDAVFAQLPKSNKTDITPDTQIRNGGKIYLYERDIPQTIIEVALPSFGRDDPDYFSLLVLNHLYGGSGFGSRLMEEAREKRGLTYGIYSSFATYRHANSFSVSTSTKNESVSEMMDIIRGTMTKAQNELFTATELEDAKSYIIGSMPLALSSTNAISSMMLGLQENDLPVDYLDTYADKIRAVTAEDLQRVAKKVLTPDNMMVVMVGKPQNLDNVERIEKLPNVE
jgi:zinc protease